MVSSCGYKVCILCSLHVGTLNDHDVGLRCRLHNMLRLVSHSSAQKCRSISPTSSGVTGGGQSAPRDFLLLKTTGICFGSTKMGIFYRKKHFTPGKKLGKMSLPPQKNMPITPLPTRWWQGPVGPTPSSMQTIWLVISHSNFSLPHISQSMICADSKDMVHNFSYLATFLPTIIFFFFLRICRHRKKKTSTCNFSHLHNFDLHK